MTSTSKHSWYDPSTKPIKDELIDCELSSLQSNDIDYTIIDSDIDPLYPQTSRPLTTTKSSEKSAGKKKKKETVTRK
jgi:hypothetical protein